MPRSRRLACLVAVAASVTSACLNLDGFSGGGAGSDDGSAPASEAGGAGGDAATLRDDGGLPVAVDGSDSKEAAAQQGWCAQQTPKPTVCDGFDQGSLADLWEVLQTGGSVTLDDAASYLSPSRSMRCSLANGTADGGYARIRHATAAMTSRAVIELSIRLDGVTGNASIASLGFVTKGAQLAALNVVVGSGGSVTLSETRQNDQTTDFVAHPTTLTLTNQWRHLRLEATLQPARIVLTGDTSSTDPYLAVDWQYPPSGFDATRVAIGAYSAEQGAWTLHVDDVAATVE